MLLQIHRRHAAAARASPTLWAPFFSTLTPSSKHLLPYDVALAAAGPGLKHDKLRELKNDLAFERLVSAVSAFHAAAGHWIVPYHLTIPSHASEDKAAGKRAHVKKLVIGRVGDVGEIDWPREAGGLSMGRALHKLMTNSTYKLKYPEAYEGLRDIGFPVDEDWREYVWTHQKLAALRIFHRLHEHTMVPIDFVVPRGDATTWPVCTWGFRLGRAVDDLRCRYDKLAHDEVADLESIDFCVAVSDTEWSEMILPSLQTFAKLYGHCKVEKPFVVPSEAPWPKMAWGLKLGRNVSSMRTLGSFADQAKRDAQQLDAINFIWIVADHRWEQVVMPALETYTEVHGSCASLTYDFVVPFEAPWPEAAWGFHLGALLRNVRFKGYFTRQIARDESRLRELAFDWKPPSKPRRGRRLEGNQSLQ